jgi:hypothetical protein
VGVGELSRLVRDVLVRFEGLAARLETQFVRTDVFEYYKQLVNQALMELQVKTANAADKTTVSDKFKDVDEELGKKASRAEVDAKLETLTKRIADLEDDKRWLVRLIGTFIVLGILGAVFAVAKAGGGA